MGAQPDPAGIVKLFLTGFMGAGKSAVGSQLAKKLGVEFVDLDAAVEGEANMSVAGLFEARGEEHFRQLEHEVLCVLSADPRELVIATGGGTPTFARNVELMRTHGTAVWLDPPFDSILARLDDKGRRQRPLFLSSTQARELFRVRRSAYATADVHVRPGGDEAPEETVLKILAAVGALSPRAGIAEPGGPVQS